MKEIDSSFFDKDYFENGIGSGKSWLVNYHWMPRRTFKEAFGFIDYLGLDESSCVLDFGCAKGFLVRALRILEIISYGCDISDYALSFAPKGCWNSSDPAQWINRQYTHVIAKDVFEHIPSDELKETLIKLSLISPIIMCIMPMGDKGVYRIREYEADASHIIAEDEKWWIKKFDESGWKVKKSTPHVPGIKDNWAYVKNGNHVFVIEHK
jgi:hypothetical protein